MESSDLPLLFESPLLNRLMAKVLRYSNLDVITQSIWDVHLVPLLCLVILVRFLLYQFGRFHLVTCELPYVGAGYAPFPLRPFLGSITS